MAAFERNEIISATQLVRNFSTFMNGLTNHKLNKIGIIRNNEMEAVVIPVDEYEKLLSSYEKSQRKSVKDFFGTVDSDSASLMEAAVSECRKVDLNEW